MNCLTVILKPGFNFNALGEIERFLKRALPNYEYENDGVYLDIEPLGISISEPYFQVDNDTKLFLCISFFIRDSRVYDANDYIRIHAIMSKIAIVLKTDEYNRQNQKYIFAKRKVQFSEFSRGCLNGV